MMQPFIWSCMSWRMPASVLNKRNPKIEKKKRQNTLVEESSALFCTLLLCVYCSLLKQVHTGRLETCNASKCHCPVKIMCHYFTCADYSERQRSRIEYLLLTSTLLCTYLAIYSPISQIYDQGNLLSSPSWVWVIVLVCTPRPQQMQGNMPIEN